MLRVAVLLLMAWGLCGCVSLQAALVSDAGVVIARGIAYGPEARQKLDVYRPDAAPMRGTIVYVYGGSWTSGDRALYRFLGAAYAARGWSVVVPDYRLYPEVTFPAFVEDTAKAVAWARANEAQGRPLFLMGHSAGAQIALLLALDPRYLAAEGLETGALAGVVGLAGPYTFDPLAFDSTRPVFETAPDPQAARPIVFARGDAPPLLLLHGQKDTTVSPRNSRELAAAVQGAGGAARLIEYPGVGHIVVVGAIAWPLRWRASVLADTLGFFAAPHGAGQ